MDIKQLKTFRTVATLRSFSQAADSLNFAQSTISDQIKALELDLGEKLFNRDKRQITLTPAGETCLQYAQKMIDLEEEIRTEIIGCDEVYGSIAIRIPETVSTYFLPPILKKFQNSLPNVNLQLNSCSYYGLYEELRSGIIDCAFLLTDNFQHNDLEIKILKNIPLVLVANPTNPIRANSKLEISDIKNEPIFATTSDCNYFKILENMFMAEKQRFSALYKINSINAIKECIIAGTGIALLPKIVVKDEISLNLLCELPFEKGQLSAKMVIIWLKNRWHPPILETFLNILTESDM